jgi:biotin carboxylase
MTSKRILILGGGRYNVPSIRSARDAGFFTFVADRNPGAPGLKEGDVALAIDLNDCDALVKAVEQHGGIDGVVSMAEVGVRAAATLSCRLGLCSISEEAAANATSKAAMRRLWQKIAAYSTPFEVVTSAKDAEEAAKGLGHFPLIIKPDRSFGGSRGVSRVESSDSVVEAFQAAKTAGLPNSNVIIEGCAEGTEYSCEVLIWQGITSVLCIGQKVKSLLPYRVDVSVQYPARLSQSQEQAIGEVCHDAVSALGLTQGVAHVEFAYTDHGPVLFELGARCGGGHTPQIAHHVSGVDEFLQTCRMACGMPPSQLEPSQRRGADYRFLIFAPGVVKEVTIPDAVRRDPQIVDVGITIQPGEMLHALRSTSDRAGFLVSTGDTLQEAVERANDACRKIVVHYEDGTIVHASDLLDFQELAHS